MKIIKSNCFSGIHPHDAKSWDEDGVTETLSSITELASSSECVAIGECGLDFNRNFSPPDIQLEVFEEQIKLACRLQKPLFLHERDAHEDMVRLLQKYKDQGNLPSCVIHCFCGTVEQAIKYLSMGCYIGLTGRKISLLRSGNLKKVLPHNVIQNKILNITLVQFNFLRIFMER